MELGPWTINKGFLLKTIDLELLTSPKIHTVVQTVKSPKGLSGKICPREVPRVICLIT